MYESILCLRIDVGSSSYPEAEFLIADMIVLTSVACISGIVIHFSVHTVKDYLWYGYY